MISGSAALPPRERSFTVSRVVAIPSWSVNAAAFIAARERRGWTRERLAGAAGVHERTVRRAEQGEAVGVPSLRLLAQALGVELQSLAHQQHTSVGRSPERLAAVVATERANRRGPPHDATALTASLLEALYTTPLAYQGETLVARGKLVRQAAGTVGEAEALGAPVGVVGRFELAVSIAGGEPLHVTLHTRDAAGARRVQRSLGGKAAAIRVRVVAVTEGEPFVFFGSERGHGWTLVVTSGGAKR